MSEWWSYSLTDFLLFSSRTYYRLFTLYNESFWPAQILTLLLAACFLGLLVGGRAGRPIAATLAALWCFVAWAFHADRYVTINWAATYFAAAFALPSLLLLWAALVQRRFELHADGSWTSRAGIVIFLVGAFAYPFVGIVLGRDMHQAEVFGLAPDPTAVATLGLLCLAPRLPWHLFVIPVLWCAITGLTLWAMEAPDALIAPVAGVLALGVAAWKVPRR